MDKGAIQICIFSQSHLCRNPRALKEAKALSAAGYRVRVITAVYAELLYAEDMNLLKGTGIEYETYSDLRKPTITAFFSRLQRKVAVFAQEYLKIESVFSLGYRPFALMRSINRNPADLFIMHQELATVAGARLLQKGYSNIAFDIEDWYAEDLLPGTRRIRPLNLLRRTEAKVLQDGLFCLTTSLVLAVALAQEYHARKPEVIYNVFPLQPLLLKKEKDFSGTLRLIWFSQTIGAGRGLERFITGLELTERPVELHLLGNVSTEYQQELTKLMPLRHAICFHPLVKERELADTLSHFDIGLALECVSPPNRNLTITNKFFQYLQAGLPVITTETLGQYEAFRIFEPGFLLSQDYLENEITALNRWLADPSMLKAARKRAISAAHLYNWDNEAKKIVQIIEAKLCEKY